MKLNFNISSVILLLFSLVIFSCGYSATHRNRTEDKVKAEDFCNKFYTFLNGSERDSLIRLFKDPEFAEQGLFKIIDTSVNRYGDIRSATVDYSETFVTSSGSTSRGKYEVMYTVERSAARTKERFQLLSEDNDWEIVRYDVAPAQGNNDEH